MGVSAIKFPATDTFRTFQSAVEGQQASFGPWDWSISACAWHDEYGLHSRICSLD